MIGLSVTWLGINAKAADWTGYLKRRFGGSDVQVREVQGLQQRIQDGKLVLHLHDFIELMLKNSPDVQLAATRCVTASDRIVAAENPFDPVVIGSFQTQRSVTPLLFGGGFSGTGGSFSSGGGGFVAYPKRSAV